MQTAVRLFVFVRLRMCVQIPQAHESLITFVALKLEFTRVRRHVLSKPLDTSELLVALRALVRPFHRMLLHMLQQALRISVASAALTTAVELGVMGQPVNVQTELVFEFLVTLGAGELLLVGLLPRGVRF